MQELPATGADEPQWVRYRDYRHISGLLFWQRRAAKGLVGTKRPDHDLCMQVNPATQFGIGAVAACDPVLTSLDGSATGTTVTMGSVAYPFDGAINQLGGVTIVEPPLPTCPNPEGFST